MNNAHWVGKVERSALVDGESTHRMNEKSIMGIYCSGKNLARRTYWGRHLVQASDLKEPVAAEKREVGNW